MQKHPNYKKIKLLTTLMVIIVITTLAGYFTFNQEDKNEIINCNSDVSVKINTTTLDARAKYNQTLSFFNNGKGVIKLSGYIEEKNENYRLERVVYFEHTTVYNNMHEIIITRVSQSNFDNVPQRLWSYFIQDNYEKTVRYWIIKRITNDYYMFGAINFPLQVCAPRNGK